jgi:hypothetical protein
VLGLVTICGEFWGAQCVVRLDLLGDGTSPLLFSGVPEASSPWASNKLVISVTEIALRLMFVCFLTKEHKLNA